jgi:hypothetical protein
LVQQEDRGRDNTNFGNYKRCEYDQRHSGHFLPALQPMRRDVPRTSASPRGPLARRRLPLCRAE